MSRPTTAPDALPAVRCVDFLGIVVLNNEDSQDRRSQSRRTLAPTNPLEPRAVGTERLAAGPITPVFGLDVVAFRTPGVVMVYGLLDRMPR